jgi:phosphoglycolate phosphatase
LRRLAEHASDLRSRLRLRAVYADLDGTLFGPGSSLFADGAGEVTIEAAEVVADLHRAGVPLIPVSGRTRVQVREAARILGARDFIAEMGGLLCLDGGGEVIRFAGENDGSAAPAEAMARSGAPALLLESFPGRLEPHGPWAFERREVTVLFRGLVDLAEARRVLEEAGHVELELRDNGEIEGRYPGLDAQEVHAYHLLPREVSKAAAVAVHARRRGLAPETCLVVGDSASDAEIASHVGAVCIVANGARAVGEAGGDVYVTERPYGAGFAEAVRAVLGEA